MSTTEAIPAQFSRFLDLPKEVRLMVYDCIVPQTCHHVLPDPTIQSRRDLISRDSSSIYKTSATISHITLVTKCIPAINILCVSRQIHDEAKTVLAGRLEVIKAEPLRLLIEAPSLPVVMSVVGQSIFRLILYRLSSPVQYAQSTALCFGLDYDGHYHTRIFLYGSSEYESILSFVECCATFLGQRSTPIIHVCILPHDAEPQATTLDAMRPYMTPWRRSELERLARLEPVKWWTHGFTRPDGSSLAPSADSMNRGLRPNQVVEAEMTNKQWEQDWEEGQHYA